MHGCLEESDAQLAHEVPQSRKERRKEMNTAVCINAVAKSSTILLPIVINKLGHSDPQGFITQLKSRLYLLPAGQSAGQFKPCGPLCSLRTNSSLIARPQSIYCRWRVDCLLVLHSSNWEWPLTVHDFSAVALPNCEMVPPPSSVLGMQGHVRIKMDGIFRRA